MRKYTQSNRIYPDNESSTFVVFVHRKKLPEIDGFDPFYLGLYDERGNIVIGKWTVKPKA